MGGGRRFGLLSAMDHEAHPRWLQGFRLPLAMGRERVSPPGDAPPAHETALDAWRNITYLDAQKN